MRPSPSELRRGRGGRARDSCCRRGLSPASIISLLFLFLYFTSQKALSFSLSPARLFPGAPCLPLPPPPRPLPPPPASQPLVCRRSCPGTTRAERMTTCKPGGVASNWHMPAISLCTTWSARASLSVLSVRRSRCGWALGTGETQRYHESSKEHVYVKENRALGSYYRLLTSSQLSRLYH